MKTLGLIAFVGVQFISSVALAAPFTKDIKEGHFRLQGLQAQTLQFEEYLTKGCYKRPINRDVRVAGGAKEMPAGQSEFWVEASVSKPGVQGVRYAYVKLNGDFEENKRYFLNRSREGNEITIWAQEADSDKIVSNIVKTTYQPELPYENGRRKAICGAELERLPLTQRTVS